MRLGIKALFVCWWLMLSLLPPTLLYIYIYTIPFGRLSNSRPPALRPVAACCFETQSVITFSFIYTYYQSWHMILDGWRFSLYFILFFLGKGSNFISLYRLYICNIYICSIPYTQIFSSEGLLILLLALYSPAISSLLATLFRILLLRYSPTNKYEYTSQIFVDCIVNWFMICARDKLGARYQFVTAAVCTSTICHLCTRSKK